MEQLGYSCSKCDKSYATESGRRQHMETKHDDNGANRVTCTVCNKSFSCRSYLLCHAKTHTGLEMRKVPCTQCDKVYLTAAALKQHTRRTHMADGSEKRFPCTYCDKKFWSSTECNVHARTHTGERPHPCLHCKAKFGCKGSLDRHILYVHGASVAVHDCPEVGCGKQFRNPLCLKRHLETHLDVRPTFPCLICGKLCNSKQVLTYHVKCCHDPDGRQHACSYCDKKFPTAAAMRVHLRRHTGEKPYRCSLCNQRFTQDEYRRQHEENAHTGKRYPCPQCGNSYKWERTLQIHMRTHEGLSYPKLKLKPCTGELATKDVAACPICDKKIRKPELTGHLRIHTGEKPYACLICPARFATSGNLSSHKRFVHPSEHTRAHCCSSAGCGKSFNSPSRLRAHMATHSEDRPLFSCQSCGCKYVSRSGLSLHTKFVHEGHEMEHTCEYCGKKFMTGNCLRIHLRAHTGEKPCACPICPRRFRYTEGLRTHLSTFHSDERPYSCAHCEARFKLRSTLRRHTNTHKSKDERRMFQCTACGMKLADKAGLKRHMAHHGNRKEYEKSCQLCAKTFATDSGLKRHIKNIHTGEK